MQTTLPSATAGGIASTTGGNTTGNVGGVAGEESSLSNWVGPYVTDMLGKGQALSEIPYQAYTGPLTAGSSPLQDQAFGGIASLVMPDQASSQFDPRSFTDPGVAGQYMNPYVQQALDPRLAEMRRQAEIDRVNNAGRMTRAGSFGGSRQAIMESELQDNTRRLMDEVTGSAYVDAYNRGADQFNTEERLGLDAANLNQDYGMQVADTQLRGGQVMRDIVSEGIDADRAQFEEERDYPYEMVQYQQSLLDGLPVGAQNTSYVQPGALSNFQGGAGGIMELYDILFGGGNSGGNSESSGGNANLAV